MCTDCNELDIPIGETGARGEDGANGSNGADGIDGVNGTSILYPFNDPSGVTSGSLTNEISLQSYTIPANTLANDGDEIELYAYLEYVNPNTVTVRFKLAGLTTFTITLVAAAVMDVLLRFKVARVSTGEQLVTLEQLSRTGSTSAIALDIVTTNIDETVTNTIQLTAQNGTAGANQLNMKKFVVYQYLQ